MTRENERTRLYYIYDRYKEPEKEEEKEKQNRKKRMKLFILEISNFINEDNLH